ncbi:MAG: ribose-phosphate pyrophosphokinase [Bacteroidetes bacterium]|nr:ribose-phosphate pyrophosphokinase [Bacteroidota bacterium]
MDTIVKFFTGRATRELAGSIATNYGSQLGDVSIFNFSDGEFQPSFEETVRGAHVFIIQSTPPPHENIFELLMMIDAAKRASAKEIIAVVPYLGYARQDRKDKSRVAITSKLVANLLQTAGMTRLITIDLHADQIQGFFEVPVDHLFASTLFIPYLEELNEGNLVIAAPDTGGTKRANVYAKYLNAGLAVGYKERKEANQVQDLMLIGDVEGKDVVLVDDMVDTAGTLMKAVDVIFDKGAKSVRALCTHAVLSGGAYDRIEASNITELVVTDTIPLKQECSKIKVLSVSDLFAKVIKNVVNLESISSHFVV